MLRITEEINAENTTLRLEGRLVGEWVELLGASITQHDAAALVLDLLCVSYANPPGLALLLEAQKRGVTLQHSSLFLQEMIRQAGRNTAPLCSVEQPAFAVR